MLFISVLIMGAITSLFQLFGTNYLTHGLSNFGRQIGSVFFRTMTIESGVGQMSNQLETIGISMNELSQLADKNSRALDALLRRAGDHYAITEYNIQNIDLHVRNLVTRSENLDALSNNMATIKRFIQQDHSMKNFALFSFIAIAVLFGLKSYDLLNSGPKTSRTTGKDTREAGVSVKGHDTISISHRGTQTDLPKLYPLELNKARLPSLMSNATSRQLRVAFNDLEYEKLVEEDRKREAAIKTAKEEVQTVLQAKITSLETAKAAAAEESKRWIKELEEATQRVQEEKALEQRKETEEASHLLEKVFKEWAAGAEDNTRLLVNAAETEAKLRADAALAEARRKDAADSADRLRKEAADSADRLRKEAAASADRLRKEAEAVARDKAQLQKDVVREKARFQKSEARLRDVEAHLREAEAEKGRLSKEAEAEKARLSKEAEAEKARLLKEAEAEKARLSKEAKAEIARLSKDVEAKARLLEDAVKEKARILAEAEQSRGEASTTVEKLKAETAAVEEQLRLLQESQVANFTANPFTFNFQPSAQAGPVGDAATSTAKPFTFNFPPAALAGPVDDAATSTANQFNFSFPPAAQDGFLDEAFVLDFPENSKELSKEELDDLLLWAEQNLPPADFTMSQPEPGFTQPAPDMPPISTSQLQEEKPSSLGNAIKPDEIAPTNEAGSHQVSQDDCEMSL